MHHEGLEQESVHCLPFSVVAVAHLFLSLAVVAVVDLFLFLLASRLFLLVAAAVVVVVAVFVVALALLATLGEATSGTDISSQCLEDCFTCMAGNGDSFVIIRGWQSFGAADPNCPHTIYNAWAGGMAHVDVYLFPCAGMDGPSQVTSLISYLQSYNATYGTIWLDIETNPSSGCGWSGSTSSNCNYIASMISAGKDAGHVMGVYVSEYMWGSIAGSGCTAGADAGVALWYPHYDDNPSFSDFEPFGGWTTPAMKQYNTGSMCDIGVDYNWYP